MSQSASQGVRPCIFIKIIGFLLKESRTSKVSERADIATVLCVRKYLLTMPTETEDDNKQSADGRTRRTRTRTGRFQPAD